MSRTPRQAGFTLVELALVLLILGLVLAGAMEPLRERFERARVTRAERQLEQIRGALLGYAAAAPRPRLPCPDCPDAACAGGANRAADGREDRDPDSAACDAGSRRGLLPWATLGVAASDPWGNRYSYRVAPAFAAGFDLDTGTAGSARVLEREGAGLRTLAADLPVLYFSHGPDGRGATGADGAVRLAPAAGGDQAENLDDDRNYVSAPPRTAASGEAFDDRFGWVGPYELKYFVLRAGRLP